MYIRICYPFEYSLILRVRSVSKVFREPNSIKIKITGLITSTAIYNNEITLSVNWFCSTRLKESGNSHASLKYSAL